jgi:serine phosphatase RsbU (regulator of sigma subunit)
MPLISRITDYRGGLSKIGKVFAEFGEQRLADVIGRHWEKPLDEIAHEISATLAALTGDAERHDDTTLILARRL